MSNKKEDKKVLIFTATYNEAGNIRELIKAINSHDLNADILVVDDNSNDGTEELILELEQKHPNVKFIVRPRKLGIGTAHKYALIYAVKNNYDLVVTMDADFSHHPDYLPALLDAHEPGTVVTGSRYCKGGTSDYTGYRNAVSKAGNIAARTLLGFKIKELTTYYRVFDTELLKKSSLHDVKANGYAYGLELFCTLRRAGAKFKEVPIHFQDRTRGQSKIPRWQIVDSTIQLILLSVKDAVHRLSRKQPIGLQSDYTNTCPNCKDNIFDLKLFSSRSEDDSREANYEGYQCTSVGEKSYPSIYRCLNCDMWQVLEADMPNDLEDKYSDIVDEEYLKNEEMRKYTFGKLHQQVSPFIDDTNPVLEIGSYAGMYMSLLKRDGYDAYGIEPSKWATGYAKDTYDVNVRSGILERDTDLPVEKFGTILTWDVFEHVRDPNEFLKVASHWLRRGGFFCFTTLDIDSWPPKVMGGAWPWYLDMHLFYFDKDVLADMLRREGFKLEVVQTYTHYAWVRYVLEGGAAKLPKLIGAPIIWVSKIVPAKWIVPVGFGDIKLFIARKL